LRLGERPFAQELPWPFVLLRASLKYGGHGPIASPGKAVRNSRKTHSI
jgi:hypothetical protein